MYKILILFFLTFTLFGCSKSESSFTSTVTEEKNVALSAEATASYDSPNASLVIDGNTSESYFWAGNIAGDNLIIDLGSLIDVTKITVYANNAQDLMADSSVTFEFSSNGVMWTEKLQASDLDIPCRALSLISGVIECDMRPGTTSSSRITDDSQSMRYFRVTLNAADPASIHIYEIAINGWVQKTT